MAEQYPFVLANNRIPNLFDALSAAARPPKFSQEFLRAIGFTSSNDRAFIPLFRRLGFIDENSNPTEYFDRLRDKQLRASVLAERLRDAYSDIFSINTKIHEANEDDLRGAISRVTGKDAPTVQRYTNTFKALAALADFGPVRKSHVPEARVEPPSDAPPGPASGNQPPANPARTGHAEFHYNIQIHLPATSDISVYNAIFRALKDNLSI